MRPVTVAFFIFNRPEETVRVFTEIRRAQPSQLYVVADGPRTEDERPLCEAARAVATAIDWPCVLHTNFSEKNLGCGRRVSSGLNWVFEQAEEAIILEDDCLPDPSFFTFCKEMLERYRDDTRIMHIAGTSVQEGNKHFNPQESYYFSCIANIWGWATWRRAWKLYDYDMLQWPALKQAGTISHWMNHPAAYERFSRVWDQYYQHEIDSWDGQWNFTCLAQQGLCINPIINLVTNIGFDKRGTHFKGQTSLGNRRTHAMEFPLVHPAEIVPNRRADAFKYRDTWGIDNKYLYRLLRPFKENFPATYQYAKKLFGRH
jgi:hypothetical protein